MAELALQSAAPALVVALLVMVAAPPGLLLLHALRLVHVRHARTDLSLWLAATALGLVLLPWLWSGVAILAGGRLSLAERAWVWAALLLLLLALHVVLPTRPATRPSPRPRHFQGTRLLLVSAAVALTAFAWVGIQPGLSADMRVARHTSVTDTPKHLAVMNALVASDRLPPPNGFIALDGALRYYYDAYVVPATLVRALPTILNALDALIGLALLGAAATVALVYHAGRALRLSHGGALLSAGLVGCVGGLDVVYMVRARLTTGVWPSHIDLWAVLHERVVNAPSVMFIWVPQHVLGLCTVVLVVWLATVLLDAARPRVLRLAVGGAASVCTAALVGTSTLIWLALMAGTTLYAVSTFVLWYTHHGGRHSVAAAGGLLVSSVLLAWPFLPLVAQQSPQHLRLVISPVQPGWAFGGVFSAWFGPAPWTWLLDFPLALIPEFGVVYVAGLAGLWAWGRRGAPPALGYIVALGAAGALMLLAVRTTGGFINDLGLRASSVTWVVLAWGCGALWEVRRQHLLWRRWPLRAVLGLLLLLGVASALYEPWVLRWRNYSEVAQPLLRVFVAAHTHTAPDDVVLVAHDQARLHAQYHLRRRLALSDLASAHLYVGTPQSVTQAHQLLAFAATTPGAHLSYHAMRTLGATHFIWVGEAWAARADGHFRRYFTALHQAPYGTIILYELAPNAPNALPRAATNPVP